MQQTQRVFVPHNAPIKDAKLLPVQAPSQMFGRNRELGGGHVALKAGTAILLHGPAGVGKTAIAAVLAAAYTAQSPGGVLWFTMTEDDADLLLARVGRAYGVNSLTTDDDTAERLRVVRSLLERNRPLIVLDGLTDTDAVREFARSAAAGIPLLVTNDKQAAGPWTPTPIRPLAAADSVSMLRTLSNHQEASYAEDFDGLARLLDGNLLALDLAGRHMAGNDVKPAELLTALLSAIPQGVARPDPQQMILSVVYKQLASSTQAVLLVMGGAFSGSASAELLSDMSGMPAAQLVPTMRQLVARGLLHESFSYGQVRYTLHESVQSYVRQLLSGNQRLIPVENRALQAVVAYTLRHARPDTANHDRLAAEIDNIVGAAAFATSMQQEPPVRQLVQALTQQSGDFVTLRGFQTEVGQLRKLLSLLGRTAIPDAAPTNTAAPTTAAQAMAAGVTMVTPIATPPASIPAAAPPITASPMASTFSFANVPTPSAPPAVPDNLPDEPPPDATPIAPDWFITDPETLPTAPDSEPEPDVLPDVPTAAPSNTTFTDATLLAPPIDSDATLISQTTRPIAVSPLPSTSVALQPSALPPNFPDETRDSLPIERAYESAPLVTASANAVVGQSTTPPPVVGTTTVAELQSKADDAKTSGDFQTQAAYLQQLGDAYLADNDAPRAVTAYMQAIESMRGGENWVAIALAMEKLGGAYLVAGNPSDAATMLEQALVIFRRERQEDHEARVLTTLGSTYELLRDWPKAQEDYEQALYLIREKGDQPEEAALLGDIAYAHDMQSNRDGAILSYRQALHMAYTLNDTVLVSDYEYQLGRLLLEDGHTLSQAVQLLSDAHDHAPDRDDVTRLLKRGHSRLDHLRAGGVDIPEAIDNAQYAADSYPSQTTPTGAPLTMPTGAAG